MFKERLLSSLQLTDSPLCVGLDPSLERIPLTMLPQADRCIRVLEFCTHIIEVTSPFAAAFKLNLGFFEALGHDGFHTFHTVLKTIPSDKIIIADAKRGDIGNTASRYAEAFFDKFNVDSVTLNPLMGLDTFIPFLQRPEKNVFSLVLTSNSGAQDFLLQPSGHYSTLSERIAHKLAALQPNSRTDLGMVVGATQSEQLEPILDAFPKSTLLIPGVGSQGGNIKQLKRLLSARDHLCLINVSRDLIYFGKHETNWLSLVEKRATYYHELLKPLLPR